jgi:bacterioferritin
MAKKAAAGLVDLLNKAIAREIQVSIQYMWQHVQAVGFEGATVGGELKSIAITEMKHAEALAERLNYLGGVPTTKPDPIEVGKGVREMIKLDVKAEEEAIALYKSIIKAAADAGDVTTRKLLEGILADEEEHHDYFSTLLEK